MAPLPASLSPHVCILSSPDLNDLLSASSLPPLAHILQSFSPLPQVTTRTTSLTSVPHSSFGLRFSSLSEIEAACREDEEQRAERTLDWIGARINNRCARWLQDVEEKEGHRTPWWDELKRCAEGDHVPSKTEGWNHPVAILLAVSTTAPNPLQAITALHSRTIDLPPWVDSTFLRYTLIVHPQNSPLSEEEAGALFNAVKKQYGLHSFLLQLALPSPPPAPVPIPALIPRLPPPPSSDSPEHSPIVPPTTPSLPYGSPINTLKMSESDIQQTAKFTREFVVMSLIPWMEKCVLEWNENFSSNRRLPSRLFSSTRRLFGSPSPSPAPTHVPAASLARANTLNGSGFSSSPASLGPAPPSQQRRLAEFATILGDFKLAVMVWESLRKESKGGSEVLPLLLSPSPTIPLHAANSLSALSPSSKWSALAQLKALSYAVRWEIGIGDQDFLGSTLEGERWLVLAAGNAEEPPSALLLAHAALLSARKSAKRRAAFWYMAAANRLEKSGIKPLTMHFLRKAHELYRRRPTKALSPLFWESEGDSPGPSVSLQAIASGLEHPLGRLSYTTGDVAEAVKVFLGLLRGPSMPRSPTADIPNGQTMDKLFLDDFRVAFAHLKSTAPAQIAPLDLKLAFEFCDKKQTRLRLARNSKTEGEHWRKREEIWNKFWKRKDGKGNLMKAGQITVDETFYVDVALRNPLDTDVNLSKLTVIVDEPASTSQPALDIEVADDVLLGAGESITVPIAIKSSRPKTVIISHIAYDFISLLPSSERLSVRGKRLHNTQAQRVTPTYGPDVVLKVDIVKDTHKLLVHLVEDQRLLLVEGEVKSVQLQLENCGIKPVGEVWMLTRPEDHVWVSSEDAEDYPESEVEHSTNSLMLPEPCRIPLTSVLHPGETADVSILLHASQVGEQRLSLFFVYREDENDVFRSISIEQPYHVERILAVVSSASPSISEGYPFLVDVEVENISGLQSLQLDQIITVSPTWNCATLATPNFGPLAPLQSSRVFFRASSWIAARGVAETFSFVSKQLRNVLQGHDVDTSGPPEIDVLHTYHAKGRPPHCSETAIRHFISCSRRNTVLRDLSIRHPHIPERSFSSTFPLYHPNAVDVVVVWSIPSQERHGLVFVPGVTLGAGHAALQDVIAEAENAKVKRSIYAETQRERQEITESIKHSEWNTEMSPVVVRREECPLAYDSSKGPCPMSVPVLLRNYSTTHTSRYVLRLNSQLPSSAPDMLPPSYSGRVTFRGTLQPLEYARIAPRMWIASPGTYALSGWRLETEVLEKDAQDTVRHRYEEEQTLGSIIIAQVQP
ncbi:hypothetical protein MKEN_00814700 [Mycena kentingensis (nom. inval.)]|nr:hypothetical protein MKEN_00814700 [Mycena kentingensis (nom. inval.)]